jgi:2-polyprenyl-3-methyl-5-hydroxy-6-metoxy-1,4-benzoquinol methylase
VRAVSDKNALYERYFSTQAGVGAPELEARQAHEDRCFDEELDGWWPVDSGARVLEIGCGWGPFLHYARRRGYAVRGLDVSPEQVEVARSRGIEDAEVADAFEHLAAHPGAYDAIFLFDVIEHFSRADAVRLVRAIHASLKPGGAVVLRTPNADAPFASVNVHGDLTHELALNAQSARQLLVACGLEDVEIRGSHVGIADARKERLRKLVWPVVRAASSVALFALGRSTRQLLTPQMLARGVRR